MMMMTKLTHEDFIKGLKVVSLGKYDNVVKFEDVILSGSYVGFHGAERFKNFLIEDKEFAEFYIHDVEEERNTKCSA